MIGCRSTVTDKILTSTWSSNLVSGSLGPRLANFDLSLEPLPWWHAWERRKSSSSGHDDESLFFLEFRTLSKHLRGDVIPSPSSVPYRRRSGWTLLPYSRRASWESNLILLANTRRMAGGNSRSSLYRCQSLQKGRGWRDMNSSSGCSSVDVFSEFRGEAGWIKGEGSERLDLNLLYLFFKNVNTET